MRTASNLERAGARVGPPGVLTDAEVVSLLLEADRERARWEARELALLGELDARHLHAVDGALEAGSWLAQRADLSRRDARRMAHDARRLRVHPRSAAAAAELGPAKVCA